jgi:hypothetical protein
VPLFEAQNSYRKAFSSPRWLQSANVGLFGSSVARRSAESACLSKNVAAAENDKDFGSKLAAANVVRR